MCSYLYGQNVCFCENIFDSVSRNRAIAIAIVENSILNENKKGLMFYLSNYNQTIDSGNVAVILENGRYFKGTISKGKRHGWWYLYNCKDQLIDMYEYHQNTLIQIYNPNEKNKNKIKKKSGFIPFPEW
jgi:hypothetical protein